MIIHYAISMAGKAHGENICQDYSRTLNLDNGWSMALVADGVGSAENAAEGSRIAVETTAEFCLKYMPWDYNTVSIKSMLRTAFNYSLKEIRRTAMEEEKSFESFDTTLTVAIYNGHRIVYGHSGDGAIIGLSTFGEYFQITTPQHGEDGVSVVPLREGYTSWEIGECEEELASVLLLTDGMLSAVMPYLLRENGNGVYVPLAAFFADPDGFANCGDKIKEIQSFMKGTGEVADGEEFFKELENTYSRKKIPDVNYVLGRIKEENYPMSLVHDVQDDKTIAALINTEANIETAEPKYYNEPDWNSLREIWNRKAYPHLFKRESENKSPGKVDGFLKTIGLKY